MISRFEIYRTPRHIPLFVYGTLKKGFSNHRYLQSRASVCIGNAETVESLALYVGRYPFVVSVPAVCPIKGEVYLTDQRTLERIDGLEEHPSWYRRRLVKVRLSSGQVMDANLYFFEKRPEGVLENSGTFTGPILR